MSSHVRTVQGWLRDCGWPVTVDGVAGPQTREAVADFQRGYAKATLPIDGRAHLATRTYYRLRRAAGDGGHLSTHFTAREWKSHGNGWIKVHRSLIRGLEELRKIQGSITVYSGYRDPAHNAAVGGASNSQHKYGNAADIPPEVHLNSVRRLGVFSGIGYIAGDGRVRHVDVRHEGPNTTGGTRSHPTIWTYAG